MITSSDYGAVEFTTRLYWSNGNDTLKEEYGTQYPINIYSESADISKYVKKYRGKL